MKSWPCVQFTGSLGSSIIKGQDLRINSNVRGGTLFIDDNQIAADGSSVNLSSLGKAAFTYSNWSSHNEFQYRVKVAHVIGENVGHNEKWLDHSNVDVFDMLVDLSVGEQSYLGRMAYVTTWNLQFGDVIQPGDSGGGVFYNDRLIGVTLAAHSSEGPISINGSYFVSLKCK